jgi:hypothetical protein
VECDGNEDDLAITDNDGGYVCYSVATNADAELIAAAPELLAALQDIIRCAHINTPYGGKAYFISDGRMDAARAAITKAERSA